MVILGTQYAGEMKKGIFTIMHYLMPRQGILSLHSGCNVGKNDDVSLFFGLSGRILLACCLARSQLSCSLFTPPSSFCIIYCCYPGRPISTGTGTARGDLVDHKLGSCLL